MKTMKAAIYYANDDVRVETLPRPEVPPGGLLIKTAYCGVCVADTMEWYNKPKAPIVLGHEATGIVVGVGEGCDNFSIGARVSAHHHVPCMVCDDCRANHFTVCKTFKSTRYNPGGFCEYFSVSPRHAQEDTLLIPDNISYAEGTLVEPLGCVIHGIRRLTMQPHHHIAIIGAGVMGLLFVQALRAYGFRNITVFEKIDWRKRKAEEFGATVCDDAISWRDAGGRADRVLVIAKDVSAVKLGLSIASPDAELLLFATPGAGEMIPFDGNDAFFKEIKLIFAYSADHNDTREALRLISTGLVDAKSVITHYFPLSSLSDAIMQTAGRGESLKCVIEIDPNPTI